MFKFSKAWRGERGYTFVELLVAITMLAIVFIPVAALLTTGYAGMVRAGRRTAAANLCREKIEEVKANGYSYYRDLINAAPDGIYVEIESSPGGFNYFRRETMMQRLELALEGENVSAPVINITVQVRWQEFETERSVKMESSLTRR